MSKKLYIVLGNGFTLDFLNYVGKSEDIDVANLFRKGSEVPWPVDGVPGFLSFRRCPNLWNLGVRPNMTSESAWELMEDIITCVNVFASREKRPATAMANKPNEIYIRAYNELSDYLKHLFIFYDNKIPEIPDGIFQWSWLKFLQNQVASDDIDEIIIVTYNYDIWLERVLQKCDIPFRMGCLETDGTAKITIYKPHGSISFAYKTVSEKSSYGIKYGFDLADGKASEFEVKYNDLDNNYLVSALIPPAGASDRFNHSWAGQIRKEAEQKASQLTADDDVILCGSSYWHVDRAEIDRLLVNCDTSLNITMINPVPNRAVNAVLTSIFSNYIYYTDSRILEDLL